MPPGAGLMDLPLPVAMVGTKRVGHPDELEEEAKETVMPKGQYDRSKAKPRGSAAAAPAEPDAAKPDKPARKARTKKLAAKKRKVAARGRRAAPPRLPSPSSRSFAVWDDGSVEITAANCAGRLEPDEASQLVAFIQRLKGA